MIQYDAIRLIAIMAIVVLHTAANGVNQFVPGSADWWLANIADSASRIGVPLFLLLTGALLLNRRSEPLQHYYRRRWQRLAWPVLAYSLFYLAWAQLKAALKQQPLELTQQLSGILSGHNYFHLWFIYLLIGIYAVLPFVRWCWQQLSPRQQLWLTGGCLVAQQSILALRFCSDSCSAALLPWPAMPAWLINADQLPWPLWFIAYLPYLLLGALLGNRLNNTKLPTAALWCCLLVTIALTAGLYAMQRQLVGPEPFYYAYHRLSLPVMLSAVLVWLLSQQSLQLQAWQNRAARSGLPAVLAHWRYAIVQHSFGIYLVHPVWLDLSNALLQQPMFTTWPYAIKLPVQVLLIISASTCCCILWQQALTRLKPNQSAASSLSR